MSELPDNPFALRPRQRSWVASLKGLLVVAGLLVAVLALQGQARQWLLQRWVVGLSGLPAEQQIERLRQLDALGDFATATLARQIAADDPAVAQAAAELLRRRQSEWATRDDNSLARAHGQMLAGLHEVAAELPPERARLVAPLLHQTILECVEQRGETMRQTYAAANELSARLAGDHASAATAISRPGDGAHEQRTVLPAPSLVPLPVRLQSIDTGRPAELATTATPSPPEVAPPPPPRATLATGPAVARPAAQPVRVVAGPSAITPSQAAAASQVAVHKQAVHKQAVHESMQRASPPAAGELPPTAATAPAAAPPRRSTREVIQLLASKSTVTHDQAVAELRRRGLSDEEIRIANQLAAPQREVRLGLLASVAARTDIDPRPWLLWLAEDADRQVRLGAVTALAALRDSAVQATLRKRLEAETDAEVIAQLRQVVQHR